VIESALRVILSSDILCTICRVAGNTVWSHMACDFP